MTKPVKPDAALEAVRLVNNDRGNAYGDFDENMNRTAALWSAVIGTPITGIQVAQMMACFKIDRMRYTYKQDNYTDAIGYLLIADNMQAAESKTETPQNEKHPLETPQNTRYNPVEETR